MKKAVIALFDNIEAAYHAVRDLVDSGVSREQISMMSNDQGGVYAEYIPQDPEETREYITPEATTAGAGAGAVIGGFAGLLVGLGALVIPAVGPVIAAGPLAAALSSLTGAAMGAVAGGITGGLVGLLVDFGLPEETAQYYAEGVRRGGALIVVRTEEGQSQNVEHILARHGPINVEEQAKAWVEGGWGSRGLDPAPEGSNRPGRTPDVSQDPNEVPAAKGGAGDYLENVFRNYYHNSRNSLRYQYQECRPAYELGQKIKTDPRFWKLSWEEIEPVVREEWEKESSPGNWDDFRDSVRYMWEGNFED